MKLSLTTSTYCMTGLLCALGASQAGLAWWYARSDSAPPAAQAASEALSAAYPNAMMREMLAILGLLGILGAGGGSALLLRRRMERPLQNLHAMIAQMATRAPARTSARSGGLGGNARHGDLDALTRELDGLRALLAAALRAEDAMRDSDSALIMTDRDFLITAVNPRCEALFRTRAADLRTANPEFDPHHLIGRSVNIVFAQAMGHQQILSGLDAPRTCALQWGTAEFEITAWPVRNPATGRGEGLQGYMLRIEDVTQKAQTERQILAAAEALALGQLSERISLEGKAGFSLAVADALNTLGARFEALLGEARDVLSAQARRDLSAQMRGTYPGAFADLSTQINAAAECMAQTIASLQDHAGKLHTLTREIQVGAGDLAERANHQASTLQGTSAATEQLSRTVADNAARAELARTSATSAQVNVDQSAKVARSATQAMGQIADSSRRISEIISLIDDIAFQTNLLALNASVEAARAGDAGKGFAVVASEVRRLAQSAAQASAEVKTLIQSSSANVRAGVDLVERSASSLRKIEDDVRDLSGLMEAIAEATREQAQDLRQVHASVTHMDEITQKNRNLAETTNAALARAETQTRDLDTTIAGFRLAARTDIPLPPAPPIAPMLRASATKPIAPPRPLPPSDAPARPSPARDLQVRVRRSVTAPAPAQSSKAAQAAIRPAAPPRSEDDWSEF